MSAPAPTATSMDDFVSDAQAWLDGRLERLTPAAEARWGEGSDRISLFRNSSHDEEQAQVDAARAWQQAKYDAGYGALEFPIEHGGAGLTTAHERAFRALESTYAKPLTVEALTVGVKLLAHTIDRMGSEAEKQRWIRPLRRADVLCCQLFSEPGAGSDLGALTLRAVRDGDDWIANGQKVWTSGAQFADVGYLIARTDPDAPRQSAFTVFALDLRSPGVTVRPLRQMTGGSTFNEVFIDNVRIPDSDRLFEVGDGWRAMMTTLAVERSGASDGAGFGNAAMLDRLRMSAREGGVADDDVVRQQLARLHTRVTIRGWAGDQLAEVIRGGGQAGTVASMLKLGYTRDLLAASALATDIFGLDTVVDTGQWGRYAWSDFTSGIAGIRFAGGTDEIQLNTIAERMLHLPKENR